MEGNGWSTVLLPVAEFSALLHAVSTVRGVQLQQDHPGCLRKPFVPGSDGLGFTRLRDALGKTCEICVTLVRTLSVIKAEFAKQHIKINLIRGDGGKGNKDPYTSSVIKEFHPWNPSFSGKPMMVAKLSPTGCPS